MTKTDLALPLLIDAVGPANLLQALEPVRGCLKTASMLWMRALGLPVLSGVVVDGWSRRSAVAVNKFLDRNLFASALLRVDKRHDRWTQRRGGYLVEKAAIPGTVEELRREGMLALLLEPESPYRDSYSLAGVTIPEESKIVIEVVGPGFDASDILRSDIAPHERWEVGLTRVLHPTPRPRGQPRRVALVTREQYIASVELRLAKVGLRAKNPAFPDAGFKGKPTQDAISAGQSFLRKTHQTLLLRHAKEYAPVPEKYVTGFSRYIEDLLSGLSSYGIHLGSSSIAASVIPKRGLIFWDFFPARKQDAVRLYSIG